MENTVRPDVVGADGQRRKWLITMLRQLNTRHNFEGRTFPDGLLGGILRLPETALVRGMAAEIE